MKGTAAGLGSVTVHSANLWLSVVVVIPLTSGCSGSDEPTDPAKLEGSFRGGFHFSPPPGTQIALKYVWVGDAWVLWMRFTDNEQVFK